jgi:hypothetical protein
MATEAEAPDASSCGAPRLLARAFGVELALDFPVAALPAREGPTPGGATVIELADAGRAAALRAPAGARVVGEMVHGGEVVMRVHDHPSAGFHVELATLGDYAVARDGRRVRCAPPAGTPAWQWQRGLIGQILPLVATLRGYEVLHASVLVVDDRAFAVAGAPGAGKSTLALHLAALGAGVLAEDTVALVTHDDRVVAEPGVALVSLRLDEARRVGAAALATLGEPIGEADKALVLLPRVERATRLAGFYLLAAAGRLSDGIRTLGSPDPFDLISTVFVPYVETPEARLRHLDTASAIARLVPVHGCPADRAAGPAAVASALMVHMRGTS